MNRQGAKHAEVGAARRAARAHGGSVGAPCPFLAKANFVTYRAAGLEIPTEQKSAPVPATQPRPQGPPQPRLYVLATRTGRLANRLVLFANFIGLAEERQDRVLNVAFHSYAALFETTRRDIFCRYPAVGSWVNRVPGAAPTIRGTRLFYHLARFLGAFNGKFPFAGGRVKTLRTYRGQETVRLDGPEFEAQLGGARIIFPLGWRFRAPGCVQKHAEKIRAYFQPVASIRQTSRQALARVRECADLAVGVHIRQGDYREWRGGKYFYPIPRYAAWMRELADQFPGRRVSFLVCSDEPRHPAEFAGLNVGFGAGQPVPDLYALAGCDYIFGPPSTFSQWASFQGNVPLFQPRGSEERLEAGRFSVSRLEEVP